ncbi:hypothetical protein [Mycolicibacterium moriokaense]|uniref:Uncharacterized protein n=1 Tax=Mycolicibacterium moriokaense TaxID=39691 RepID=A0A318I0V6_9MYCO|nr:hypothetical protein [Mycolicibacterium moriokaense]PXX11923.1 hypothetical protein C8E89_10247 [Mycolicibacterium moriokaense]
MLFPVMLFLLVLSPLFIPMAVTVAHQIGNLRENLATRPVGALPQFRPAFAMVPAAA